MTAVLADPLVETEPQPAPPCECHYNGWAHTEHGDDCPVPAVYLVEIKHANGVPCSSSATQQYCQSCYDYRVLVAEQHAKQGMRCRECKTVMRQVSDLIGAVIPL